MSVKSLDSGNHATLTKGNKVLLTDMIAVTLALIAGGILSFSLMRTNARLEKENTWLRGCVRDLRKQLNNAVERPF
jgi:cell division protein FtsL